MQVTLRKEQNENAAMSAKLQESQVFSRELQEQLAQQEDWNKKTHISVKVCSLVLSHEYSSVKHVKALPSSLIEDLIMLSIAYHISGRQFSRLQIYSESAC